MRKSKNKDFFTEVTRQNALKKAWLNVQRNGKRSSSKQTRDEVERFSNDLDRNIRAIQSKLRKNQFSFAGNRPVTIRKNPRSKPRSLVVAPVPVRVIQRSILNLLQKQEEIKKYLDVPTSFGAIKQKGRALSGDVKQKEGGVPGAIRAICKSVDEEGMTFYIRSDIKNFFNNVNLDAVIEIIRKNIGHQERFISLLKAVTKPEFESMSKIRKDDQYLFDFEDSGIPQGCSLSPLIANIFLYNFDIEMNDSEIKCFRYLDDFIILGKNERLAKIAFKKAKKIIFDLGLDLHEMGPNKKPSKTSAGHINSKFEFLGVEFDLKHKKIRPSSKNQNKLIGEVKDVLKDSIHKIRSSKNVEEGFSVLSTLSYVNRKIKGWGNTFIKACGDEYIDASVLGSINKETDDLNGY